MRRVLALVSVLAVALAAPMTVEGKKKKPPPLKVNLKSWQVELNNNGKRIDAPAGSTFTYCADDGVSAIYALGQASPATKGRSFNITWKLNGSKIVSFQEQTGKGGKVVAQLSRSAGPLFDGTYAALRYNPNKKTSKIRLTLKGDASACP
jgi:hypothetical protein